MDNRRLTGNRLVGGARLLAWVLMAAAPRAALADDGGGSPPLDPGSGYIGILPTPPLPPGATSLMGTSPWGVRQVFNAPELLMGQSFTATAPQIDWIGFVIQNSTQPSWPETPGAGQMQVTLYSDVAGGMSGQTTILTGLLATSDVVTVPMNTTQWGVFSFEGGVALTSGALVYAHVQHVGGYPSWVGGRLNDVYRGGSAFGYLWNPFRDRFEGPDLFGGYDLVFAAGTLAPVPEPAAALLLLGGLLALGASRRPVPAGGAVHGGGT